MLSLSLISSLVIFGTPIVWYAARWYRNRQNPQESKKARISLLVFSLLALIYVIASYYDL
ncbi:MAG: hypothetical protein JNM41_06190 [Flavipsychrobacter sp.]|nr:hypothetical protein [Flavipsychrobacter sp.]